LYRVQIATGATYKTKYTRDTENVAWQRATNDQSDVFWKYLQDVFYVQAA
jgi:hypothetical protein